MKPILLIALLTMAFSSCGTGQGKKIVPADAKATEETVNLLSGLSSLAERGVMFGHQDDLAYGIGWIYPDGESDVKRVCSDYPALLGMDLGHLELGHAYNLDSVPFDDMRTFTRFMHERGGIVTYSWHADNPLTGGNAWDVSSDKAVASVLPGGENNEKFRQWLDRLADFFLSLTDEKGKAIPVIFRPYHEHTGSWFWWGQKLCTTEEYTGLWRFTVDYLCDVKNVHNLLFTYSSSGEFSSSTQYLERYPGDDYIDIVGFDSYYSPGYIREISKNLGIITTIAAEHGKIATLAETGYESVPDSTWWTKALLPAIKDAKISYVLLWRNAHNKPGHFYAPYPGQASEKDFVEFYNLPQTLFLDDLSKESIYE